MKKLTISQRLDRLEAHARLVESALRQIAAHETFDAHKTLAKLEALWKEPTP